MKLSFHVCNTPCAEEYYMGVNATYEAYIVDVPDELFPAELLRVLKEQDQLIRNDKGEVIQYKIDLFDWLNKKMFDYRGLIPKGLAEIAPEGMYELKLLDNHLSSQNESDSVIDNTTKITIGCKIRSKTNPIEILSIISDDCHGDEFECSNGSVLSLKQIEKYYELIK